MSSSAMFTRKGSSDTSSVNGYAVSISQNSFAQSSIMNLDALALPPQNVEESDKHQWREGHSMRWRERQGTDDCAICFETTVEPVFICDSTPTSNNPYLMPSRLPSHRPSSLLGLCNATMSVPRQLLPRSHPRRIPPVLHNSPRQLS